MMDYVTGKFLWWLENGKRKATGEKEIINFLAYVGGPAPEGGRWGNPAAKKENSPRTVKTYWERLRNLLNFGVEQGIIKTNPMARMKAPIARPEQKEPFSEQDIQRILDAATTTRNPKRDATICLLLLDTGIRNNELCTLKMKDLDLRNRQATVLGKGNKRRTIYIESMALNALKKYLRNVSRRDDEPVFTAQNGKALTTSGLLQLMEWLGKKAKIDNKGCYPHRFRHTAASMAASSGMNEYTLMEMLGHSDPSTSRHYVVVNRSSLKSEHQRHSPSKFLDPRWSASE